MTAHTTKAVEAIGGALGIREPAEARWLERLVRWRMDRAIAKAQAKDHADDYTEARAPERARRIIRAACTKTAVTGLFSGGATTAAALVTAETDGAGGVVAVPAALAAVGGEMLVRAIVHVDLACELGEVFGLGLKANDDDVLRVLSLVFGERHDEREDLGQHRVRQVMTKERDALLERAGNSLLGESVLRNLLPFVGVVSSALTNVVVTYRLGHTLRRAFRYQRAMDDAFATIKGQSPELVPLVVEGIWFMLTADGRLSLAETACLAQCIDELPEREREAVIARFTVDERAFLERAARVPEEAREAFLEVLEVAAALEKGAEAPVTRILERLAEKMERPYDAARVRTKIEAFERLGVD